MRKISVTPLQISSPMAESMDSSKPIKKPPQKSPQKMQSFRNFFSCKYHRTAVEAESSKKKKKRMAKKISWSGSLCSHLLRESSKVTHRPETPSNNPNSSETARNGSNGVLACQLQPSTSSSSASSSSLNNNNNNNNLSASITASSSSSSFSSVGGSFRAMHLRRLSGCYECHVVVDPISGVSRVPSLRRSIVFPCSDCGEIFTKSESLEIHQTVNHAVSELGPEDSSRNVVEIIFTSSWLKKQSPMCKIVRILRVQHRPKAITKFESYRDSIKSKASKLAKKHPRCIADGNELLRFHCTSLSCTLGRNGSTGICQSVPGCGVCSVVRDGFKPDEHGRIRTMATSGRAHDAAVLVSTSVGKERAMLVCRVIAGRVKKNEEGSEECDSVAGSSNTAAGVYSNLDELFVFDPKAILPCFVVVYKSL